MATTVAARTPERSAVADGTVAEPQGKGTTSAEARAGGRVMRARRALAISDADPSPSENLPRRAASRAKQNIDFNEAVAEPSPTTSVKKNTPPTAAVPTKSPGSGANADVTKILRGVYAMVDVRLGADAEIDCSDAVAKKLGEMGATILKKKGGRLTHVVVSHYTPQWKEKVAKWHSVTNPVEVVSQLWVNACFTNKQRMKESAFFPVNKGVETGGAMTPMTLAMGGPSRPTKKKTPTSSAAIQLAMEAAMSSSTSTGAAPSARAVLATRKRRAKSMEPLTSDAIQQLLETSKKLQRQSSDGDVYSAIARLEIDEPGTPQKRTARETKAVTPPLAVRLRAAIERRKSIASSSNVSREILQGIVAEPVVPSSSASDCVADSCSEGDDSDEDTTAQSMNHVGQTTEESSGVVTPSPMRSPASQLENQSVLSLNLDSPSAPSKGAWACSICSSLNAKSRRLCKGCKASRIVAKTTGRDKTTVPATPPRTPVATRRRTAVANSKSSASAPPTPSQQPPSARKLVLQPTPVKTPTAKPPVAKAPAPKPPVAKTPVKTQVHTPVKTALQTPTKAAMQTPTKTPSKRPRSPSLESSSTQNTDASFDVRVPPSTPKSAMKKPRVTATPTPSKKAAGPPRAIIGITGVDSEGRGVIEAAVHGIDVNASNEPGHRRTRVVKSLDYAAGVTHLIVGKDTKRTIKVLFAIARGAWIVSEEWVFTSLAKAQWLNEEDYEVDVFPRRQRRLVPEQRQVFRALKFFVGAKIDPSREVMMSLIQCAGGEIVNQISVADYCICGDGTLFRRAERTGIKGVIPKWVFDSIANLQVEDHTQYQLTKNEDAVEDIQSQQT